MGALRGVPPLRGCSGKAVGFGARGRLPLLYSIDKTEALLGDGQIIVGFKGLGMTDIRTVQRFI
jgi:hypothetical protein